MQPKPQLANAHLVVLAIALVLNACLLALDPTNIHLQTDALSNRHEAVQISQELLGEFPEGLFNFMPIALAACWAAPDDTYIIYSIFSIANQYNCCYWTDPAYMKQGLTLKQQIQALRMACQAPNASPNIAVPGGHYGQNLVYSPHCQPQDMSCLFTPDLQGQLRKADAGQGGFSAALLPPSDFRR